MATIFLIEPYFRGSHASWAHGLIKYSNHNIHLFSLPGNFWKWRMHGAAISLSKQVKDQALIPDLFLVSDMLDLPTFLALCGPKFTGIPTLLYFHENQLSYPWSPTDKDPSLKRDNHYAFLNYTSALVADHVCFNSAFHLTSFLDALPAFLNQFPDHQEIQNVDLIRSKSSVLSLGIEYGEKPLIPKVPNKRPVILWNHRWEYDKNPDAFFQALMRMKEEGIDFSLILLGESFQKTPASFKKGLEVLQDYILHSGYVEDKAEYYHWLQQANVLPVTSRHDFFGISVVQAIQAGVYPLLPRRYAYPEHIPPQLHEKYLYNASEELYKKLKAVVLNREEVDPDLSKHVAQYAWSVQIHAYDKLLDKMISNAVE
ncbi:MAG: DUF3524 domain-containing protein [Bacteroidota bacterium]